jgi:hypothetical protein
MIKALSVYEAIPLYRSMVKTPDPYGKGEDTFINTQSAGLIVEIRIGGKRFYVFDFKTEGYPQKNFVNTYAITAGNWRKPGHKNPFDVLSDELHEEIKSRGLADDLLRAAYPFAVYMGAIPRDVHGNAKHPADVYVHDVSIFAAQVPGQMYEDHLKISLKRDAKEVLTEALKPFYEESTPGVLTAAELENMTRRFSWGYDKIFQDYLEGIHSTRIQLPGFEGITTHTICDMHPWTPFADRPTSRHNRLNPLLRGETPDSQVFRPE